MQNNMDELHTEALRYDAMIAAAQHEVETCVACGDIVEGRELCAICEQEEMEEAIDRMAADRQRKLDELVIDRSTTLEEFRAAEEETAVFCDDCGVEVDDLSTPCLCADCNAAYEAIEDEKADRLAEAERAEQSDDICTDCGDELLRNASGDRVCANSRCFSFDGSSTREVVSASGLFTMTIPATIDLSVEAEPAADDIRNALQIISLAGGWNDEGSEFTLSTDALNDLVARLNAALAKVSK